MTLAHTPALLSLATPLEQGEVRVVTLDTGERARVRAAARALLAPHAGVAPDALEIVRGDKGKPLVATDPTLHYSVAHSGDVAMIAITRVAPVGVDVERVRAIPNAAAILTRFFSPEQVNEILTDDHRDLRFTQAWTEAEARVKARGASVWEAATPDPGIVVRPITAPDGYAASIALLVPEWHVTQHALSAAATAAG